MGIEIAKASSETKETNLSIWETRSKLGALIRTQISFPREINGIRIKLRDDTDANHDNVDEVRPFHRSEKKTLNPLTINCETLLDGEPAQVTIQSSAYPFAKWRNLGERSVDYTITVPVLDYEYVLMGLNWNFIRGIAIDRKLGDMGPRAAKKLAEIVSTLQDPTKTAYETQPLSFAKYFK